MQWWQINAVATDDRQRMDAKTPHRFPGGEFIMLYESNFLD
jgi:hypothetical protein